MPIDLPLSKIVLHAALSIFLVAFVQPLLLVNSAHAQDRESYSLNYSAPETCPSKAEFSDEVAARVGMVPFSREGLFLVNVDIKKTDDGYRGVLRTADGERETSAAQCATVARNLAATLGVQISGQTNKDNASKSAKKTLSDEDGKVEVRVESEKPDLGLHVLTAESRGSAVQGGRRVYMHARTYAAVCALPPCAGRLSPGRYQFAVSQGDKDPVDVKGKMVVDRPMDLKLDYVDNSGSRVAALLLGIPSLGMLVGFSAGSTWVFLNDNPTLGGTFIALAGVGLIGVISSMIIGKRDQAIIRF